MTGPFGVRRPLPAEDGGVINWEELMNRDELEGKAKTVKGKIKQAAGHLTDDPILHDEGAADEAEGTVQDTWGRAKRKVGEAIEDVGEAVKK